MQEEVPERSRKPSQILREDCFLIPFILLGSYVIKELLFSYIKQPLVNLIVDFFYPRKFNLSYYNFFNFFRLSSKDKRDLFKESVKHSFEVMSNIAYAYELHTFLRLERFYQEGQKKKKVIHWAKVYLGAFVFNITLIWVDFYAGSGFYKMNNRYYLLMFLLTELISNIDGFTFIYGLMFLLTFDTQLINGFFYWAATFIPTYTPVYLQDYLLPGVSRKHYSSLKGSSSFF